jgi:hypothetical protein
MLLSRSRLIGMGLTVAAVASVSALAYAAIVGARQLPRITAERGQVVAAAEAGDANRERIAQREEKATPPAAKKDTLPEPRITPPIARTPLSGTKQPEAGPTKTEDTKDRPAPPTDARGSAPRDSARADRNVRVAAPNTDVNVDKDRGNVRVRAPYTKVDVDPDRGQVRVRAPYVNLDIRW